MELADMFVTNWYRREVLLSWGTCCLVSLDFLSFIFFINDTDTGCSIFLQIHWIQGNFITSLASCLTLPWEWSQLQNKTYAACRDWLSLLQPFYFFAFVVPLWSNCFLLYSAPVGVDDQIDNWDSRPSNPFSHWSPADQARQPWQVAQSSLWLRSTVGTELPRSVRTYICMHDVHIHIYVEWCLTSVYTQDFAEQGDLNSCYCLSWQKAKTLEGSIATMRSHGKFTQRNRRNPRVTWLSQVSLLPHPNPNLVSSFFFFVPYAL